MVFQSLLIIINFTWLSSKIITQNFIYNLDRPTIALIFKKENNKINPFINTFHPFTLIRTWDFGTVIDDFVLGQKTLNLESEMEIIDYKTEVTFESNYLKDYHIYLYKYHAWYPDHREGIEDRRDAGKHHRDPQKEDQSGLIADNLLFNHCKLCYI